MRTRAGWIALVLTGGLALAPTEGRAQGGLDISGREAAPTIPLPIYNRRPEAGGFYGALEFILYRQTRHLGNQPIAKRGFVDVDGSVQADIGGQFIIPAPGAAPVFIPGPPGPPGAYIGSGNVALRASDLNSQRTYQPGYATTIGYRFSDGSTFEARWRHVEQARYNAGADIIPAGFAVGGLLEETFLFAPVFNFNNEYAGQSQELGLGNPGATYGIWNAANQMTIQMQQRYDQADFFGKVPIRTDEVSRTYLMAGGRFAWIWERFTWRTVSQDASGASTTRDVAYYTNSVSNRMYGPSLGLQQDFYLGTFGKIGAFSLAFSGDASTMLNIVKEHAKYELADESTSSKKSVREYTFVPMFNGEIQLTWYAAAGIQVRMSWNSLLFMNTVHTVNPVSFNLNNIGRVNDFGPGPNTTGSTESIWSRRALHYFDGINFGVALSF